MLYRTRLAVLILLDSVLVLGSLYLSYIPMHPSIELDHSNILLMSSIVLLLSHHLFATVYRLYNKAWEYASIGELSAIVKAVTFAVFFTAVVQYVGGYEIYMRAIVTTWMLYVLSIGGSRFMWRLVRDSYIKSNSHQNRALIIGAGSAGVMVTRQLMKTVNAELKPVAFIDDDANKNKLHILGIPVIGDSSKIAEAVEKYEIDNIIIAIPSLNKDDLSRIFEECAKTKVKTQIMPKIEDIMLGKVSVNNFREVQVEDLLGREPVELDMNSISESITGKTVLVTGAGGSIGSEICRQICKFNPSKIVLVGHGENSIYQIDMELRGEYGNQFDIIPVIADIQDRNRMFEVMEEHQPFVVYHAAAHKHVPLMEYNPREAVKNNIFGTKNVAEAADTFGVETFVMISTDKAVNPPNVMGATKRFAEMIVQHLAQQSKTKFVAVRFGNVLGSRGSVIPLFKKQIQAGGPVTVTHPEMTRYFMTIPEASRLVIQAGSLARGGEIFVLDMGEPVKIVDLAINLIKLSGYSVEEIGINYAGIRPGEKLFEELLNENEVHHKQVFPKIHIGKAALVEESKMLEFITHFENMNENEIRQKLLEMANRKENKSLAVV